MTEDNEIKFRFDHFRQEIEACLSEKDVNYFIEYLRDDFGEKDYRFICDSNRNEKVTNFFAKFDDLSQPNKYKNFISAAEKHNKWISTFLSCDMTNEDQLKQIKAKWIVLENTVKLISNLKNTFKFSDEIVYYLYENNVISLINKDYLLAHEKSEGNLSALFLLFHLISMKDPDWYGHLLYIIAKQDSDFIHILCEDMENGKDLKAECLNYGKRFIEIHMQQYVLENSNEKIQDHDFDNSFDNSDDKISDYGSLIDSDDNEDNENNDLSFDEPLPDKMDLKKFQVELCNSAINGNNLIIYAPTGAGKTNMAVYITNEHFKSNPDGKVAFLVHRIPLVNQQYRVFQKYKSSNLKVVSLHGRTDNISGPLIAQIATNDIFVMTSEILRNALITDDGNKIKSINEFSLIFFDECHNCMKGHPYVKIMLEYFQLKRSNQDAKLPQIVGLTASPRTNKKDNKNGIQRSVLELCANLDCMEIAVVQENKEELEEFLAQPQQTVHLPNGRSYDDFEKALLNLMELCEKKLTKMRNEYFFQARELRDIPTDKFKPEYVGFIGNLERLNTVTTDECDGKQKAYTIYRFLRGYYKGLIVNQMFDQKYALKTIKQYLKHSGVNFTCSFDEEFYKNYKSEILDSRHSQSSNPAIDEIVTQIRKQLSINSESRILIFVREINFTNYLVNILKEDWSIPAEAIVGSNSKTDSKTCTDAEINNILNRFSHGETRVLVATTVVEEGLDVALCNMVISYGHVTNETAMIQRRGRVRAVNSKYLLVLPPMLKWLEKKERVNEHRKDMMREVVEQLKNMDRNEMKKKITDHQRMHFTGEKKKPLTMIAENEWKFTCKNCQTFISLSSNVKIIEKAHRVCMDPMMLKIFKVVEEERKSFGSQGNYEYGGKVQCNKCNNYSLGNFIYYRKIPFFQLNIATCNSTNFAGKVESFKKWANFAKFYTMADVNVDDLESYSSAMDD